MPLELVRRVPMAEFVLPTPYYSMVRFRKWDDMIKRSPRHRVISGSRPGCQLTGARWLTPGPGKLAEARTERDSTTAIAAANAGGQNHPGSTPSQQILSIAAAIAAGKVAMAEGKADEGVSQVRKAVAVGCLTYDEPPTGPCR